MALALSFDVVPLLGIISTLGIWCLWQVEDAAEAMVKRVLVKEYIAAEWLVATSVNSMHTFALAKSDAAVNQQCS